MVCVVRVVLAIRYDWACFKCSLKDVRMAAFAWGPESPLTSITHCFSYDCLSCLSVLLLVDALLHHYVILGFVVGHPDMTDYDRLRHLYTYCDEGLLRMRTTCSADTSGYQVAFGVPHQAILAARACSDSSPPTSVSFSSYDRLCLRYPSSKLGEDAESVVARSLARASATELARLPVSLSKPLAVPSRDLRKLHFPRLKLNKVVVSLGAIGSSDDRERTESLESVRHLLFHDRWSIVAGLGTSDGFRALSERWEFLSSHRLEIFKEAPDLFGNDLLFWDITAADTTIQVFRIQVKLGLSEIDVNAVATSLVKGWDHVKHFFACGETHPIEHVPIIWTTRDTKALVDSVDVNGVTVHLWHKDRLVGLWPSEILDWGRFTVPGAFPPAPVPPAPANAGAGGASSGSPTEPTPSD